MAARSTLRAVSANEPAPKKRGPKTVTQAADSGTQLDLLVAMRARVAKAVEDPNTPARDLAALTRRLLEIARDIEAIKLAAEEEAAENAGPTPDAEWEAV